MRLASLAAAAACWLACKASWMAACSAWSAKDQATVSPRRSASTRRTWSCTRIGSPSSGGEDAGGRAGLRRVLAAGCGEKLVVGGGIRQEVPDVHAEKGRCRPAEDGRAVGVDQDDVPVADKGQSDVRGLHKAFQFAQGLGR